MLLRWYLNKNKQLTMIIFIDESGIHKQSDHTSIVLTYIESKNQIVFEKQIVELEFRLGIPTFHWAESVWRVKEKFLDSVLKMDFQVKVVIFSNPVQFVDVLERALTHLVVEKNIHAIYIDGKKPKWYERKIKKTLRDKGIVSKKLKTVRYGQSPGIRVADMVAGLTRSIADGKNKDRLLPYYKRLQKKIIISLKL